MSAAAEPAAQWSPSAHPWRALPLQGLWLRVHARSQSRWRVSTRGFLLGTCHDLCLLSLKVMEDPQPPCLVGPGHRHWLPQGRPFGLLQEPGERRIHRLPMLSPAGCPSPVSSDVALAAGPHTQCPSRGESLPGRVSVRGPRKGSAVQCRAVLPVEMEAILNAAVRQRRVYRVPFGCDT